MAKPTAADGLAAFFGGIGFVMKTPGTWGYALVPVAMMLALLCGFGGTAVALAPKASDRIMGLEGGFATWTHGAVTIGLGLVFLLLAGLLAVALAQPLSGWALEAIARKQEMKLTGGCPPEPDFLRSLWIGVRCSLFIVVVGGLTTTVLFAISFLFPPAVVVTVPLKFLQVAWILAWDLTDYPQGLHGAGIRKRLGWALGNFGAFTAFGVVWSLVLLIPGVFLLVLPFGVAGATRLVVASEFADVEEVIPT